MEFCSYGILLIWNFADRESADLFADLSAADLSAHLGFVL